MLRSYRAPERSMRGDINIKYIQMVFGTKTMNTVYLIMDIKTSIKTPDRVKYVTFKCWHMLHLHVFAQQNIKDEI